MEVKQEEQQLTELERSQIESNIKEDLVEHLYHSVPSGVTNVFLASTSVFIFFYSQVNLSFLFSWLASFYLALFSIAILYLFYKKNVFKISVVYWQYFLAFLLSVCAVLWGSCLLFSPKDQIHQFALLGILFMVSAALSMATVGFFGLAVICVFLILSPLIIWLSIQQDFYYQSGAVMVSLYMIFLLAMNYRSTLWLKNSLRLKIENSYFTHQANHDFLSGLPNQRVLSRRLEDFIDNKVEFAIICFSINLLEMYSSSLGYQVSDLIIQAVAKRLILFFNETYNTKADRPQYFITHPRTDSFIILISPVNADTLRDELYFLFQILEAPFKIGTTRAEVMGSIGVSIYPKDGDNAKAILSNAYAAMFQAKKQGGNQIKFYNREMNARTPYLLELENDLHHVLKKQELVVYYQPIVALNDGCIAGMEALVRWQHPKYGLVSPEDFIFLAEENGTILTIGKWVLKQACFQVAQWNKQNYGTQPMKVAVNLSSKQLQEGSLLNDVETILKETGLSAHYLDLELTETAVLDESVAPLIHEFTKRGIDISIDDFGTGYSGLNYLRFFKIDTIKIDRSFIQDMKSNADSVTIVSAIIAMAKALGMSTIAEGVENEDQLRFLLKRGCQYGQGYYFSPPISAADFTQLIKGKTKYDKHILQGKIAN